MGRPRLRFRGLRAATVLAVLLGCSVLLPGLLFRGPIDAAWFVPAFDVAAIIFVGVAAALAGLDAALRRDSRSMPVVLLAGYAVVLWTVHLCANLGLLQWLYGTRNAAGLAEWSYLVITVTTPAILAASLLHWGRPLAKPVAAGLRSLLSGWALGLLAVATLLVAVHTPLGSASPDRTVLVVAGGVGLAGLLAGLGLLLGGHRGDERIASGVAAALVISGFANLALALDPPHAALWYSGHILAALPFGALLAGQFSIYERSVRAERDSEARLRAIFEGSGMGICLIDATGRIIEVNARTEEMTGYARSHLRGMTFTSLLHPEEPPPEPLALAELRRGNRMEYRADVCIRTAAGEPRWLRLIVSRFPAEGAPGGPYFVAMGQDISEQRQYQEALAATSQRLARAERVQGGVELVGEMARALDPAEIAATFVARVVATIDADRCSLLRVDVDGMVMEASFDRTRPTPWIGERFSHAFLQAQPLIRQALETRDVVLGGRLLLDQTTVRYGSLVLGVRHTAAVPLLVGDDVGGLLILSRVADRPFTSEDLGMLRLIGNVASFALHNARLFAGAQEASHAKTLFLNMAAHELRTPLTVILGYLSMLMEGSLGPPSEAWRPILELLDGKSRELAALVDGILIAARLEEGPISLPLEKLDLRSAVADSVRRLQPRARLAQAEVSSKVPESELIVEAHRESLDRILDNLLNNAIAYSPFGPRIRIAAAGVEGTALIAVDDDGVGVPAEMHDRIFDRLVRLDQPRGGYAPGTGLGLYISRALAERMGGSLVLAHSRPGQGSSFELRLPLAAAKTRQRPGLRGRSGAGGD